MNRPGGSPRSSASDAGTPAVNHADGIARLMGDGALFARVLARFRSEYREAALGIRRALDAGDKVLALRLAHTLKGAAGMIEAVPLRRAAHALEQTLRDGAGDPAACLTQLEQALDQVLRELDAAADSAPRPAAKAVAAAPGAHADALERLTVLLDEGNGDAVDLVRDAEATLRTDLGDDAYGRISAAIDAFDFDAALAMLKQR